MPTPGLRVALVRAVLDPAFRADVLAGRAEALSGHDLTDGERSALLGGGAEVLALIGQLLDEPTPTADAAPGPAPEPKARRLEQQESEGAPFHLLLRLMTSAEDGDGPETRLHYAAVLQTIPEGIEAADVPAPTVAPEVMAGERLADGRLEILVVPKLRRGADGKLSARYECSARLIDAPAASGPTPDPVSPAPDLQDRAAAIRAAPEDQRLPLLLDLLKALDTEAQHG